MACADRPQLQRLCEQLRPEDVLAVWNLDRLGRDLQDLLTFVDRLGKENIGFVSLTQEWADTTTPMRTFLFQVFGDWPSWSASGFPSAPEPGWQRPGPAGAWADAVPSSRPRACNERPN